MKLNKINPYLLVLLIFALVIRVYRLGELPSGIFYDEAATGYDAYSILKTGRDLHGNFLPVLLNHHNTDYVEPMYTYLTVPFVSIFDLSVFSTRFLAAVVGTLTILSTYLFAKELFNEKVGLISALLLAVSPWHLQFSRIAFNSILVPFFVTLGLFFLLRSLQKPRLFIVSALVFGLSLYTYAIMKLVAPALLFLFFCFYFKKIRNRRAVHYPFISLLIFFLLAAPIYYLSFFGRGNTRFQQVSIFTPSSDPLNGFASNLLSHLSPSFLFINGDANLRHGLPGFGQVLVVLVPFIFLALFFFIYKQKKEGLFLVSSFIVGIIPASLTREGVPHALRSISAVPFLEIIAAYGIFLLLEHLKNREKYIRITVTILVGLALVSNIAFFMGAYFVKYPLVSEDWFGFGTEEAIIYTEEHSSDYDHIILTRAINQPYIFPLFFAKIGPSKFQRSGEIGKYAICTEDIDECYEYSGKNLFIVRPGELQGKNIKKNIYNNKGRVVLKIVE